MTAKSLYDYQLASVHALEQAHRAGGNRALNIMATGLGKTVVLGAFLNGWASTHRRPALFLVHLWEAISQAEREFREALGNDAKIKTIGGRHGFDPTADVLLSTFQTMRRRYERIPEDAFSLVIVDECHHSRADTYEPILTYFKPELLLGVTATEERMDGRNIRELFGDPVYEFPLSRALAEHKLADVQYKVLTDNISPEKLQEIAERLGRKGRKVTRAMINREVFLKEHLESIVEQIREHQKGRCQTVIFCNSRKHANAVNKHIREGVTYYAGLPKPLLKERFEKFKRGEIRTFIVVDKFNEAVDVPDADLMVFLRMTESKTVWLQQLGRGLRKRPNKPNVLVLDFVANCDRVRMVGQLESEVQQALGIVSDIPTIHETGLQFRFDVHARDIMSLLDRVEQDHYPTIEEASASARSHRLLLVKEYINRSPVDPKLPPNPRHYYGEEAWERIGGWDGFFEGAPPNTVEYYDTIEEASAATRKLGLTRLTYWPDCRLDPRLVRNPRRWYGKKAWERIGGEVGYFTGVKPAAKLKKYTDLREAALAARALGFQTGRAYIIGYKKDPRLPSNPNTFYSQRQWKRIGGWPGFLRTYDFS